MSCSVFAAGQQSTINQPAAAANLRFGYTQLTTLDDLQEVTGSSGGTVDVDPVFVNGLPTQSWTCRGRLMLDSDSTYGASQASHITISGFQGTGDLAMTAFDWAVRRAWRLFDVTGSKGGVPATSKAWTWGRARTMIACRGTVDSGDVGPVFNLATNANSGTFTTFIDTYGTVSGTLKTENKSLLVRHQDGGPHAYSFGGQYSGPVTYTQVDGTDDLAWLYEDDPVRGELVLDADTTTPISVTAILYALLVQPVAQRGGQIAMTALFRADCDGGSSS